MQSSFLQNNLGLPADACPCHYIPGADFHFNAIGHGLGYGIVPELLHSAQPDKLISLAPDNSADVALYWPTWKVQSPRMEHLARRIIAAARAVLQGERRHQAAAPG